MSKYYVIKTTKFGVEYKRTKCLDYWSKNPQGCWQYSEQGAKAIAKRLNAALSEQQKLKVHFNVLEVKQDGRKKMKTDFRLTEKGIAIMAAVESGLLPKVEEGWDDTVFLKFWELFCAMRLDYTMKQLSQNRNQKARKRNKKA